MPDPMQEKHVYKKTTGDPYLPRGAGNRYQQKKNTPPPLKRKYYYRCVVKRSGRRYHFQRPYLVPGYVIVQKSDQVDEGKNSLRRPRQQGKNVKMRTGTKYSIVYRFFTSGLRSSTVQTPCALLSVLQDHWRLSARRTRSTLPSRTSASRIGQRNWSHP